jgi:prohibitin 2
MSDITLRAKVGTGTKPLRNAMLMYYRRHALAIKIGALIVLFLVLAGWPWVVVTVPAGYVAVKYYRFAGGTDTQESYGEGSHLKMPWDKMVLYQVRLQQDNNTFNVLTRDGLMVQVSIACRFRLSAPQVGWLHQNIGPNYMDTLIEPSLGSYARLVISHYSTDEVYSERREAIQHEIKQAIASDLAKRTEPSSASDQPAIIVDDVLILGVKFPPAVQAAVDRKMEQYELREEYSYRIQREELETKRKEIEARGIAEFQKIVGAGISDNYLRWKAIDATLALAQSPNTKVVVLGSGKDNVPLFLNGEDTHASQSGPSHPDAAEARAETPLTGPADVPRGQTPKADDQEFSWTRWLVSRIGALLTVPAPPPKAATNLSGEPATPAPQ